MSGTTVGRVVTLAGSVGSWQQLIDAGHLAARIPGVIGVVNRLEVKGGPPSGVGASPPPLGQPFLEGAPERWLRRWSKPRRYDVVVIGAGVIGAAISRDLSRYCLRVALVEKEWDVATGASSANNGMVHPGVNATPGSLKARLNVRGSALYAEVAAELGVSFERCGLIGCVLNEGDRDALSRVAHRASTNRVPGFRVITPAEALAREPEISDEIVAAFHAPSAGIISPYKLTIAYTENAVANGVDLLLGVLTTGIRTVDGRVVGIDTNRGPIDASFVVNAAGLYADVLAESAGGRDFTIHPRRGQNLIFDRKVAGRVGSCLSILTANETPFSKGSNAMPTVDGNLLWGPDAVEVPSPLDTATSREGHRSIVDRVSQLLPRISSGSVISSFAGLRAATYTEDFVIRPAPGREGLLNVAGIQSPGLAAAPAIAEMALALLQDMGLPMEADPAFNPRRRQGDDAGRMLGPWRQLSVSERRRLWEGNAAYGRVVCRCEGVTEGEIVNALHGPVPSLTVDAVKRRTRAGMGRCQGGFCGPKVAEIIARELGISLAAVTKKGPQSPLTAGPLDKGLLMKGLS